MSQIAGLLDTNILVDVLRGFAVAEQRMEDSPDLILGIPSLVRMELVFGTNNKIEQEQVITLLKPFPVILTSELDALWAMEQFERFHLSHQVEIIDCFIAGMSIRLNVPLYTRNTRDMRVFPDVRIVTPY